MTNINGFPIDGNYLMEKFYGCTADQYRAKNSKKSDDFATFCERRFEDMARSRSTWYQRQRRTYGLWDVFKDWLMDGEQFNKAVRFPTLRDVAKGMKTEIMKAPPETQIEATYGEKPNRVEALRAKVTSIKSSIEEKRVQEDCIDDMLFCGLAPRVVGYYKITKKYWGCEEGSEDEVTEFDDVGTERWDPRDVYFDDYGRELWNPKRKNMKRDAFLKCSIPWSTYLDWSADNSEFIQPLSIPRTEKKLSGDTNHPTETESNEFQALTRSNNVNMYFYYNQEYNVSGAVANGQTVLPPRPIDNNHGRIPLVAYMFEKRRDSFYPNSLAELLAPAIYCQDTIFNLQLMGMKLDLMPGIMVDSELGYNPKIHKVGPRAVWSMSVPAGKDMRNMVFPFQRPASNQNGALSMINQIESQITITSGQDRRSLFVNPSATATQTVAREQSSQKSIQSVVFSNELEAEGHLTEMLISDIKQFGSGQVTRKLSNGKIKQQYRKVKIEGFRVKQNKGNEAEFIPAQGNEALFELNEDSVDVDVQVSVQDTRTKMALQEQKVAKLNTAIPAMANVIQLGSQYDPELGKMIGWVDMLRHWAEANDMPSKTLKNIDGKIMDRVTLEHDAITMGIDTPVPPTETYEESRRHLEEHWRFRWVFKDGKRTATETFIWKNLNENVKKKWEKHVKATQLNIKKKLTELIKNSNPQPVSVPTPAGPVEMEGKIPVPRDESPTTAAGVAKQATI